ncbi:MAG TPA: M20/M25/M40 family metallo-hydrolase, partial [Bacteroidales bacterium]|nr:M20/M25/M40 family metallo-hydrolase [Bacteroidales bacterium]
ARPLKGRVILLFQPSEEDGKGALRIIGDPRFKDHEPDHIFAIHNLPSFPLHKVVVSNKNFASASSGMRIDLFGKTSHAAEPEKGKNPGIGMARMILGAQDLLKANNNFRDFVLLTPIHAVLGKLAYGTTPGRANLNFTLRSFQDTDMEMLKSEIEWLVHSIATQEHLNLEISYEEEFPATANHPHEVKLIKKITALKGMDLHNLRKPFKWSEDFGHFLARYPGALIGLGSGTDQPALHNPDYDFPDEIIPTGIRVFQGLYDHILNQ